MQYNTDKGGMVLNKISLEERDIKIYKRCKVINYEEERRYWEWWNKRMDRDLRDSNSDELKFYVE